MTDLKPNYCPTQSGTFTAYRAEYRLIDSYKNPKWKTIPIIKNQTGVPYPEQFGGILSTIHLFGYAQAKALAWTWAAQAEERGEVVDVRLVEYKVEFDIKARVIRIAE